MEKKDSRNRSSHSKSKYYCEICKITFSNYSELLCHLCSGADLEIKQILSQIGDMPHECSTFHSKFISKDLRQKHKIFHKELKIKNKSGTEKTDDNKPETCLKSTRSHASDYWDYVSKQRNQRKELDRECTLLPISRPDIIKSPQNHTNELTNIVNGNKNLLNNNSFNNNSLFRKPSPCNSSAFSSSTCPLCS